MKRALWAAAPFAVVAALVASLVAITCWLRAPAAPAAEAPLASTAKAVDALAAISADHDAAAEDDPAKAKAARQRLAVEAWHYAALRPEAGGALRRSVEDLLDAVEGGANPDAVRRASRRLQQVVVALLSSERRELRAASEAELEKSGWLQRVSNVSLLCAIFGLLAGSFAATAVWKRLAALREQRRRDRARTKEIEQFAARVAHDIVSPLGPVTAGVHILSERLAGDSRAQAVAKTVRASVDRVSAIVDELLRFAWSGGRPAPQEKADLARVIDSLRDELLPVARETGVALLLERPPHVQVACSEVAIQLVLQNLLTNAIKYVAGAPRKMVRATALVLSGTARLVVEDTGPGVPAGMEHAIFEPYVRAAAEGEGIGLGLATVKRIVESRGGRVGVSSSPRHGARFWVELPLAH